MKFRKIIIGLLAAILAVNIVMAYMLITEAHKQTIEAKKQSAYLKATEQLINLNYIYYNTDSMNAEYAGEIEMQMYKNIMDIGE